MRRILLLAFLALLALPATPAAADTSDFTFDSFAADYTITRSADGTSHLAVVETLVAVFPDIDQNRGIIRAIPDSNDGVRLDTVVTSVVDENGAEVPYEQQLYGGFLELALGTDEFVHGPTTYVISYEQDNVVGDFPDTADQEFYWDVNGTGWDQPFGSVAATVTIDPAIAPALTDTASCYQGESGSTDGCDISAQTDASTGAVTYTAAATDLAAGETVTIAIGFASATFVPGVRQSSPPVTPNVPATVTPFVQPQEVELPEIPLWSGILAFLTIAGAFALFIVALVMRILRSGAQKSRRAIIAQYSVPKDLNVMAAAYLAGRGSTAVPAQIISLAVRKNLRILDYPVTASGAEYTLQYLSGERLDPLEVQFMTAMFGPAPVAGQVRELAPNDAALGQGVLGAAYAASASLTTRGFRLKGSPGCLVPLLGFALVGLNLVAVVVAVATGASPAAAGFAIFLIFVGLLATGVLSVTGRGGLTPAGIEQRDYLEGMRVYLTLAEQDRLRMLQSPDGAERVDIGDTKQIIKLYEKLLPFAVIWGVEDQWAKELEVRLVAEGGQPDWFTTRTTFSAVALTTALGRVAQRSTYTPQAAPSSSSSRRSFGGSSNSWSRGGSSRNSSSSSRSGGSSGRGHSGGGGGGGGGGGR